jgi:hypothetical protein
MVSLRDGARDDAARRDDLDEWPTFAAAQTSR